MLRRAEQRKVDRLQTVLSSRCVQLDIPEELPPANCDYAQIDQVVANLVSGLVGWLCGVALSEVIARGQVNPVLRDRSN